MKKKLEIVGIVFGFILLVITLAKPSLLTAEKSSSSVPFDGMSLVYQGNMYGKVGTRAVAVLKYDTTGNTVVIRDSMDPETLGELNLDVSMVVDVSTREVLWHNSSLWPDTGFWVEYWIPTEVKIGSHVKVGTLDAEVVDSSVMWVDGNPVEAWKLYADFEGGKDTWYYEKSTGLFIGASWAIFDEDGRVAGDLNWGGHLVSTNVALPIAK